MNIPRRAWLTNLVVSLMLVVGPATAEDRPASFGFTLQVDADGIFSPTLKSITVSAVAPSSPASNARIVPSDKIIEAEGRVVAGSKASELQPLLKKQVGDSLHLRLRRASGEQYAVTLVGVTRAALP